MSHFCVFVTVPEKYIDNASEYIEGVMEPYDENKEVPEYERDCYCVNLQASNDARKSAQEKLGDTDYFRKTFKPKAEEIEKKYGNPKFSEKMEEGEGIRLADMEKEKDKEWKKHLEVLHTEEKKILDKHPLKNKPNKTCQECNGTGKEMTAYNPNSKWDWYVVGGRWDGYITDNEQSSDNGFNFDEKHRTVDNNHIKIKDFNKKNKPYSFIDSSGQWHEKGQMGLFGMSSGEVEDWDKQFDKLLKKENPEDYLVCVDCHI